MLRKKENKGLPARWRIIRGRIYYDVPRGMEYMWDGKKLFKLGDNTNEAYINWAKRLPEKTKSPIMAKAFDRYLLEIIPTMKPVTGREYKRIIEKLRPAFSQMAPRNITPQCIYKYVDKRSSKPMARKEVSVLSSVVSCTVRWGDIKEHPFKWEVEFDPEKARVRYVEDWEISACLDLPTEPKSNEAMAQSYIRLKLLTGMAQGDLLRLTRSNAKEDGIHIVRHKTKDTTGKATIYLWTDALHSAWDDALKSCPVDISPYLFCNRRGRSYVNEANGRAYGFRSLWVRFMNKVLKNVPPEEMDKRWFTEHDIRAKVASDAESDERGRALLSHSDVGVTRKHYRRKAERVMPAR